jgi:hypothetical protein
LAGPGAGVNALHVDLCGSRRDRPRISGYSEHRPFHINKPSTHEQCDGQIALAAARAEFA